MPETVGFVGLGAMGRPMARRLLAQGHRLVVHSRTEAHSRELEAAGAHVATSPAEVAGVAGIVCSCLLDTAVVEAVWLGERGLLAGARPGTVLVEHGTFAPALARRLATAAAARGAAFLDAPVTGGPEGADAGRLVAMVGGSPEALARAAAAIGAYAAAVHHAGAAGAGLELKLVNQHLVACHVAAAAEAAAMVRALGLDAAVAEQVLAGGWGASAMLARCLPRALGTAGDGDDRASVAGLRATQRLALARAGALGLALPLGEAAGALLDAGIADGRGARDVSSLADSVARRGA